MLKKKLDLLYFSAALALPSLAFVHGLVKVFVCSFSEQHTVKKVKSPVQEIRIWD